MKFFISVYDPSKNEIVKKALTYIEYIEYFALKERKKLINNENNFNLHEKLNEEYFQVQKEIEALLTLSQQAPSTVQQTDEYKYLVHTQDNLQKAIQAANSAETILEWSDIEAKFQQSLEENPTNKAGKQRLLNKLIELKGSDFTDDQKLALLTNEVIREYRYILRSGMTGLLSKESSSSLASTLRDFASQVGIELPLSLKKGELSGLLSSLSGDMTKNKAQFASLQRELNSINTSSHKAPPLNAPIKSVEDYYRLTNSNNPSFQTDNKLNSLKSNLKKNDQLLNELSALPEQTKIELLKSLISSDGATIRKILEPICRKYNIENTELLTRITEHRRDANSLFSRGAYFNSSTDLIIKNILKTPNLDGALKSQAQTRMLQNALQKIPESILTTKMKANLAYEINEDVSNAISDFSYTEPLNRLESQQFKGHIKPADIINLSKNKLDKSESIILLYSFLKHHLPNSPNNKELLNQLKSNYIKTNYERCEDIILTLKNDIQDDKIKNAIENITTTSREVVLEKNNSRRFFENRMSQFYLGKEIDIDRINKMSSKLLGVNVYSVAAAEEAILSIAESPDINATQRHFDLKNNSPLYSLKDRHLKSGFIGKEDQSVLEEKMIVSSRNSGLLKSNSPNFYDELSNDALNNRVVDVNTHSGHGSKYSLLNERSAFASSLSGHTYFTAAILEKYIQENKDDPELNEDINAFINAYIATYISRGYHSYLEIVHVLEENNVFDVFSKNGLNLKLNFSDDVVEMAFNDAAEYSLMLAKKQAVNSELLDNFKKMKSSLTSIKNENKEQQVIEEQDTVHPTMR